MHSGTLRSPHIHDEGRRRKERILVTLLAVLVLIVVISMLLQQDPVSQQAAEPLNGDRYLAANPELAAAESFAAWHPAAISRGYREHPATLAHNPELKDVARFTPRGDEHAFLAQNPELLAARRYVELVAGD